MLMVKRPFGCAICAVLISSSLSPFARADDLSAIPEVTVTADRVEDDVQAYRVNESIAPVWKTVAALLCAIGPRDGDDHVVRSAARLSQQLAVAWHAVYVETPALQRLSNAQRRPQR